MHVRSSLGDKVKGEACRRGREASLSLDAGFCMHTHAPEGFMPLVPIQASRYCRRCAGLAVPLSGRAAPAVFYRECVVFNEHIIQMASSGRTHVIIGLPGYPRPRAKTSYAPNEPPPLLLPADRPSAPCRPMAMVRRMASTRLSLWYAWMRRGRAARVSISNAERQRQG